MIKMKVILIILVAVFFTACDFMYKNNGIFGHSSTKEEALENDSEVILYLPNKDTFNLLDGTELILDTSWTEVSFSYRNGNRVLDSAFGYHLSIPFKKEVPRIFTFNFELCDKSNQSFTNGIGEELCQLCPMKLYDEMLVILEQKNTDSTIGWIKPIITDTIIFRRLNNNVSVHTCDFEALLQLNKTINDTTQK